MSQWLSDPMLGWWAAWAAGLAALGLALACWRQSRRLASARAQARQLEQERASAEARVAALQERLAGWQDMQQSLAETRKQMSAEFQNLANRVLEEKGKRFTENSQTSLDGLLRPFREQIDAFQRRVNDIHADTVRGNESLRAAIRGVQEAGLRIGEEASSLAMALKGDKKITGNWGEVQLARSLQLAGLVEGEHYEAQPHFHDGEGKTRYPDFVIKLPDGKHLVIDSKVSLVDYDRAISAGTEAEAEAALAAHVKAVRQHIDDLSGKDYSNLKGMGSPSFVLMFMPIEPAYIEALKTNRDLFNYGYQRNVVMVSHTTLMPILRTVSNLWMVARGNEQAHELSSRAGEIYNQVALVAERLKKVGASLDAVRNHYNLTVTAVAGSQGLYGKVSRFSELSAKANKHLPALEPSLGDFDDEKLALIVPAEPEARPDPAGH